MKKYEEDHGHAIVLRGMKGKKMKKILTAYGGYSRRRRGRKAFSGASMDRYCNIARDVGVESAKYAIEMCKDKLIKCSFSRLLDVAKQRSDFLLHQAMSGKWKLRKTEILKRQEKCAADSIREFLWGHKYLPKEAS